MTINTVLPSLYRLLKEAADDFRYRKRYQLLFGALLSVVGESMRKEFTKEEDFVKMMSAIAAKVKAAKDKEVRTISRSYMFSSGTFMCKRLLVVLVWRSLPVNLIS